jgi:hypothetical protein
VARSPKCLGLREFIPLQTQWDEGGPRGKQSTYRSYRRNSVIHPYGIHGVTDSCTAQAMEWKRLNREERRRRMGPGRRDRAISANELDLSSWGRCHRRTHVTLTDQVAFRNRRGCGDHTRRLRISEERNSKAKNLFLNLANEHRLVHKSDDPSR